MMWRADKLEATFKAGLLAARLGDQEQSLRYYTDGLALIDAYREQINVTTPLNTAIADLEKAPTEDVDSTFVADLLAKLRAKLE